MRAGARQPGAATPTLSRGAWPCPNPGPSPTSAEITSFVFPSTRRATSPWLAGAFPELVHSQLDELLKLVVLTYQGQRVRVDGFWFLNDAETTYRIWEEEG